MPPIRTYFGKSAGKGMYRAVSKGRLTGIFCDIEDSKRYVEGYPDANHKTFRCKEEAFRWLKLCEIDKENARLREQFGEDCTEQDWAEERIKSDEADADAKDLGNTKGLNGRNSVESPLIDLSEDQKYILDLVLEGNSIFFTGPAGSGKSLLLRHIKIGLRKKELEYAVTAPTGVAAALIDGRTIHSWSGVGKGNKGLNEYIIDAWKSIQMALKKHQSWGRGVMASVWREIDVLIIDEVSMLSPDLFEKLDKIARICRFPDVMDLPRDITINGLEKILDTIEPFGGIQLVICGDFFQLPPVDAESSKTCYKCGESVIPYQEREYLPKDHDCITKKISALGHIHAMGVSPAAWTICTRKEREIGCGHVWNSSVKYCFQTQTWSQIDFRYAFLTKVHRQSDQKWVDMLSKIKVGVVTDEILNYLVSLNRPLKRTESGIVPTRLYPYRKDVERKNKEEFDKLRSEIRTFAAVDTGVSTAQDRSWSRNLSKPELEAQPFFNNLPVTGELTLRYGAQVMLLSNIDSTSKLVNGSLGVVKGFSLYTRGRLLGGNKDGLVRQGLSDYFSKTATDKTVYIPLVQFREPNECRPILPVHWDECVSQWLSPTEKGNTLRLTRIQIPLGLAWAMTIHKSQGSTMDFVSVGLGGAFSPGQAYVGLSRCKSPEGMQVLGSRLSLEEACKPNESASRFYDYMTAKAEKQKAGKERKNVSRIGWRS